MRVLASLRGLLRITVLAVRNGTRLDRVNRSVEHLPMPSAMISMPCGTCSGGYVLRLYRSNSSKPLEYSSPAMITISIQSNPR